MLFSTSIFIFAFLPCVLFGYYIIFKKNRKWQNIFLTFSSLFFYAWGEPWFVLVMIGSIISNWAFALWVDKQRYRHKLIITLTLIMNLGIMFVFKYLTFLLTNINGIFNGGITIPVIDLPIGISFFTFQAVSYVIDVYRKKGEAQKNPLNVALYISFFPQLIAGPIVRYETIAEQIKNRRETFDDFNAGLCRFIIGLGKKMILANTLAIVADKAFLADELSVVFAWMGALAYTFQIFYDFSGYSDMAIGLGKMFGFHFLENFDYPYISKTISEFWRRWHISLGTWFRDYVYFPLGGSRVDTKLRLVFNLFVVWILTGVWHGANWTFLVWGLMYFILITGEKLFYFDKRVEKNKTLKVFGHIYTLFFVVIGWVIFRADNLSEAFVYIKSMFGIGANGFFSDIAGLWWHENMYFYIFAVLFSTPVAKLIGKKIEKYKTAQIVYPVLMTALLLITISYVIKGAYNPFIYFNF